MAMTGSGGGRLAAAVPLLLQLLLLLALTASQPNIRYPPLDKARLKKEGKCYTVTHTTRSYFNTDELPLLNQESAAYELVDRHTGGIVPEACTATKVLVSTDSTAVDLGSFRSERWAGHAVRLEQGMAVVDHDVIAANLPASLKKRKGKKVDDEGATIFMMYFTCSKDAPGLPTVVLKPGKKGGAPKDVTRTEYSVALRYEDPTTVVMSSTPFQAHVEAATAAAMLNFTTASAFWQEEGLLGDNGGPFDPSSVHRPWCVRVGALGVAYCPSLAVIQRSLLSPKNKNSYCKYNYPSAVLPNIQQSQTLGTDKLGNPLPGPMADLLAGGRLPDVVPQAVTDAEKATLYWLYDKTVQLLLYAPCTGGGSVPFASAGQFAPGFSASTLYFVSEPKEATSGNANYTTTPLAYSATGPDSDGTLTFVVAVRGTGSQSEWATNLKYDQRLITAQDPPVLAPFVGHQIHRGYSLLLEQIYDAIKNDAANSNAQRIIVTGHSLGAGVATLVSFALTKDFPSKAVDAALFAPPSVGDEAFVEAFNRLVNARRIAFRPTASKQWPYLLSSGDPVAQVLCPSHPQCWYRDPALVSTKGGPDSLDDYVTYRAVAANVLFGSPDMPAATYPGVPADTIQKTFADADENDVRGIIWTHICAYSCYFSTAVNAPLNRCYGKANVETFGAAIPAQVQQYGLCVAPPRTLADGNLYGYDNVWYGGDGA